MYIEQAYKALHESWRYLVGFLIIFIAWQVIGALPLTAAIVIKSFNTGDIPLDIAGMSSLLGSNLFLFLMLFTFAIGLIAVLLTARFLHRQKVTSLTTARPKIDWNRIVFSFVLWTTISALLIGLDIFLSPEDYVFNFEPVSFLTLLLIGIVFIPFQTSFEEYFMRGYLMQGIGVAVKNRWLPLLFTSFFFGILHIFNPEVGKLGYGIMIFYMGTGLFLGILTLMDDGLELALGFHAANNLTAALLVTADWTAFQTHSLYRDISEPDMGWDVFLPVLVLYPLLLIVFTRKYGWKDWQERLLGRLNPPETADQLTQNNQS